MYYKTLAFKLLWCQPELVEGGFEQGHQLRQAANDMYYKTLAFKLLWCQPEPVEGGFVESYRLRQALPDTPIGSNFCHLQRA